MEKPKIKVTFNPKKFNNVYWHLEKAWHDPNIRYIWLYGGSSASKTFSVVQLIIKEMLSGHDNNIMVMRKISADIKDSIYSDFERIIEEWGLSKMFVIQQNLIKCKTGSYTRFRGLDDGEKVKGITNFKKVVLEEVSQFDEKDFKQLRKRLRGQKNQQLVGIFNPIVEEHWIKRNVFDVDVWKEEKIDIAGKWVNEKGNSLILKTNYTDNKWIVGPYYVDQHVIDDYEWDRVHDYANYEIYALGNWGKIVTGGEFYKQFKREKHVGKIIASNHPIDRLYYDPTIPLHISLDENTKPYFPAGIFQIKGKQIFLIDEILARNPNNTTTWMAREISRRFPNHEAGMFIYGDATSDKDDVKQEKGMDLFKLVMNGLTKYRPHRRVADSNPSVRTRGDFFNDLLDGNPKAGGIEFMIDEHCVESINDFYLTKEASDGRKDKRTITDKITKESYQPHGHITDLTDYMLCYAFRDEYEEYKRGGKKTDIMYNKKKREW